MDDESFVQLCRETCAVLNQSDIDALSSTNQITVDGINIGVFFNAADIEDRVICYIDIGKVPDLDREEILERILAINLMSGSKTSGVYGLDRQNDRIIFVQHFLYPELLNGEIFAEILRGYAGHASSARKTLLDALNTAPLHDLLEQSLQPSGFSFA